MHPTDIVMERISIINPARSMYKNIVFSIASSNTKPSKHTNICVFDASMPKISGVVLYGCEVWSSTLRLKID